MISWGGFESASLAPMSWIRGRLCRIREIIPAIEVGTSKFFAGFFYATYVLSNCNTHVRIFAKTHSRCYKVFWAFAIILCSIRRFGCCLRAFKMFQAYVFFLLF
jgi:hypothetical protein